MIYLKKAASLPLNNRPWFSLTNAGQCQLREGHKQVAEGFLRKALQLNPSYAPALLKMAKLSYEKSEFMRARAFLERFFSYSKKTADSLWLGFQIERALGQMEKSEEYKMLLLSNYPLSEEASGISQ